jgi:hypothetical protein
MPNPIKYTAGTETLALKKGNFYIGTGDVGKGPSDSTGYYQGPSPESGGYVIYLNKSGVPGNLSYHSATNDNQLISFTNNLSGTSFTSATQCLNYYATQTDKVCFNRDYEPIVTDGLIFNLDAGFTPSYSRSGTTWGDISVSNTNATLTNGPTFNSGDGGNIVFDGSDDLVNCGNILNYTSQNFSFNVWFKITNMNPSGRSGTGNYLFSKGFEGQNGYICRISPQGAVRFGTSQSGAGQYSGTNSGFVTGNTWCNICITRNGSTVLAYFNGVDATGESDPHVNPASSSTNLNIGLNNGTDWYMFGATAIFMSYNRALSATEALQNYNAQKSRFGL